jgi:hypothetical protein
VLFTQFDWLLRLGYSCTIHLRTKTKWLPVSFRLQTSTFLYIKRSCGFANKKKVTKVCLTVLSVQYWTEQFE